jgi:hypothetical protein
MTVPQSHIAVSIISSVKNAMEVIKTWYDKRDRAKTLQNLSEEGREEIKKEPAVIREASELSNRVSSQSLLASYERIDGCFSWYANVLRSPEFFAGEVDDATKALISCICRELQTLDMINDHMPGGVLKDYWDEYSSGYLKSGNLRE